MCVSFLAAQPSAQLPQEPSNWIHIVDSDADSDSDLEIMFDDEITANPSNANAREDGPSTAQANTANQRSTNPIRNRTAQSEQPTPRNEPNSIAPRKISQLEFEEALTNLVVDELLPFSFIESQAFKSYTHCESIDR